MTLTRVWQYDVRPGTEAEFEAAYGADGAWARLFRTSDGYLGTELFRSLDVPGRYLTTDRFVTLADWHEFLAEHRAAYEQLDERCAVLTVAEQELAAAEVEV
jgi:heme-degrading monooxygenase HmoA